jgi:hypothetical protein
MARVHVLSSDLHRIDGVTARVNQVAQQRLDSTVDVEKDLRVGEFLGALPEAPEIRLY